MRLNRERMLFLNWEEMLRWVVACGWTGVFLWLSLTGYIDNYLTFPLTLLPPIAAAIFTAIMLVSLKWLAKRHTHDGDCVINGGLIVCEYRERLKFSTIGGMVIFFAPLVLFVALEYNEWAERAFFSEKVLKDEAPEGTEYQTLTNLMLETIADDPLLSAKWEGARVRILGTYTPAREVGDEFGADEIVSLRYSIVCCSACQKPHKVLVRNALTRQALEADNVTWLMVEGTYTSSATAEGVVIPSITAERLIRARPPEIVFISGRRRIPPERRNLK